MYCIKCGHEMEENAKICSNCGCDRDSRGMESKQNFSSDPVIITKKNKNGLVVVISVAAALVLLIGIFLYMITFGGYDRIRVSRLCDLGDRYLSELDYEQAIAAYEAAIEIDPKCAEAYLGLADIYIEQGNYEEAVEILEVGANQTESRIISRKLEEAEELLAESNRDENQFGNDSMQIEESQPEEPHVPEPEGLTAQEYLESNLIPAMGLLDVGQVYKAGYTEEYHDDYDYYVPINMYVQGISGIAGYDIRDYDKDGEDELLVLILKESTGQMTGDSCYTIWMQMYERDTAEFNLIAETEAKCGSLGGVDFQHMIFYIKETDSAVYVAEEYKEGYGFYGDGIIEGLYILHYTGSDFVADLEEEYMGSIGTYFFYMEEEIAAIAVDLKDLGFTESAAGLAEEIELNDEMKLNEADGLDAVFGVDGRLEDMSINQYTETHDISVLEVIYRFYRNTLG